MAFTQPGRYSIYNCPDIEQQLKAYQQRQVELEQLMARASQGAGGALVGTIAYKSEYLQVRGQINELHKAAADKSCALDSKWSSGRAVF